MDIKNKTFLQSKIIATILLTGLCTIASGFAYAGDEKAKRIKLDKNI